MIDSSHIEKSSLEGELAAILEIVNFHEMLIALKAYFDGLPTEEIPEKARQVVEVLNQADPQTREQFVNYLLDKKFIADDLHRELSSKGPRVGTQGEHSDWHLGPMLLKEEPDEINRKSKNNP